MSRSWPGLALSVGVLWASAGCSQAPSSVPWNEDQKVLGPEAVEGIGRLVVETPETGNAENGRVPHAPYYVYDERGRLLDRFPNEHQVPVDLPGGRYVVLSRIAGRNRKVQVEIRKNLSTYVTLKDFQAAPPAE